MSIKNNKSGFLQLIIIIIIAIFIMSYFHVTIKDFIDWFITAVKNVFK